MDLETRYGQDNMPKSNRRICHMACISISYNLLVYFNANTCLSFKGNDLKNRGRPMSRSFVNSNALLMTQVSGEFADILR